MVAKGHQVQLSGPGCAHDDVLVVQAQIRLAPREVVREDEETHAADSGSERVERPAVVLRLERLQPANVERHGRHRRLVDLPRQLGLFCDDRGAKDEVAAELRFRCFEVRELLPVPAEVGIVGRLERSAPASSSSGRRLGNTDRRRRATCSTGARGASS